jgi:hypothetical protein
MSKLNAEQVAQLREIINRHGTTQVLYESARYLRQCVPSSEIIDILEEAAEASEIYVEEEDEEDDDLDTDCNCS